ncbi:acylneuraminate cytidylyltransferase [Dissulfurispira thermophila]|uniref:Acylneuraminate cytidylyltransferase n=1 Tax=Dissulfurispira thermophila TaxID=2715679 RepID=A0A7G1H265_9BACT|nr:acylneuraminate cytidylyltransferase family protein [Dissulfurispira thermophila]BCB96329.1 acylneuraminate cytidylyltransferase [Dissulfurispira thermophila]
MYKDKTILAIIPARGGSKGLPRKNIKPLLGKPLIAWTIEQALNSRYIDRLIVSTEDEEIAEISIKFGAEIPFLRPKELAKDDTPTIDVLIHLINNLNKSYDCILLLEPTSPLRKKNDIDVLIDKLIENFHIADSVVGVCKIESDTHHPYGIKKIVNGYLEKFLDNTPDFYQRQQLPDVYGIFGGMYISKTDKLLTYKTFYQKRTLPYVLDKWQAFEIDYIYDFLCVEKILEYAISEGLI